MFPAYKQNVDMREMTVVSSPPITLFFVFIVEQSTSLTYLIMIQEAFLMLKDLSTIVFSPYS